MNEYNFFDDLRKETKLSFDLVQKLGPIVKSDLMEKAEMTLSTLNRVMQPLEESQIVVDIGETESTGGRKPHLYDVNKETPLFVGIELSRRFVRVGLVNLKIEIMAVDQFEMTEDCTPLVVVDKIVDVVNGLLETVHSSVDEVLAMGIGTSGTIDIDNGIVKSTIGFPDGWNNVPVYAMFKNIFDFPIYLDHGANAAVVVEHLFGAGKDSQHVAFLHVGTSIRTSVINSGKLIRAINSKDDVLSHMILDINGEECVCGNFGCLETMASTYGIVKKYRQAISEGKTSKIQLPVEEVTFVQICEAAEDGDPLCEELVTKAGQYFGAGLYNYISMMNPHTVILSGPLVSHSPIFFKVSTDIAIKNCEIDNSDENIELVFRRGCRYKENVVVGGIVAIIIEQWIESGLV